MRLISLTVRNYRVHSDLTVNFDPARNLIGGPNESGKSTLAEAAHRALFLRAKTGGNIQKEMVSTRHLGDPEVLLTFEAAGTRWELEKRFAAAKGSTRLTAQTGTTLRDDEAESQLASLLKTETAGGRGAAGLLPDLWSHLWVWQGQAATDPAAHTNAHRAQLIQQLQQNGVAAILQSTTDQRAATRIADLYAELFTATGKPKSGSKPEIARAQLEQATAALQSAREASARLAQAADDHARAEREIAEINTIVPKLRADRDATEAKQLEVTHLRHEEETHRQSHEAANSRLDELETHDRTIRELQTKLAAQIAALQPADAKLATLAHSEETARLACQQAIASQRQSVEKLRHARLLHDLATAAVSAFEKAELQLRLAERAAQVARIQEERATLRSELAQLPKIDSKDLGHLRKLDTESGQAQAAFEAMATGIELLESAVPVLLDGATLTPGETRILTESGDLIVGDGTRLRIRPGGGNSLATARSRASAARDALQSALQALTAHDLDHAAAVLEQRLNLDQKIDRLANESKSLGGESLAAELAQATTAHEAADAEFKRRLQLAAPALSHTPPADLSTARAQLVATRDALSAAETAESTATQQAALLQEKLESAAAAHTRHRDETSAARQVIRDLEAAINAREEAHGGEPKRTAAKTAARETVSQTTAKLAATRAALTALNPALLQADLERFTRSLAAQEAHLRDAENTRLLARDRLTLDGSTDPDAELRHAEARHRTASENHTSELRRAKAIESLHQLFTSSRETIDRALVQPLADRISGYLQCLFGPATTARVHLSDSGIEGLELVRAGDSSFSFATLSGGAREQTAAAVRLALAEILAADHDGCLPILFDDAFAYSDPDRIQSLQRMLDLAANRGLQIIVLSCTPADYSAFGASEIRLISL